MEEKKKKKKKRREQEKIEHGILTFVHAYDINRI